MLQPYQMIKDHRTKVEVGDVHRVLDGDLDQFIKTYLMQKGSGTLGPRLPPTTATREHRAARPEDQSKITPTTGVQRLDTGVE